MKKLTRRFLRHFTYGQKGFTLIELLVVVAILGILAAIAIPNLGRFMGQGGTEAALAEHASVQTAVDAYMAANNGAVPATIAALMGATPPYLRSTPTYTHTIGEDGTVTTTMP